MTTVADVIRQHHSEILRLWKEQAERAASARGLSAPEFRKVMPAFLSSLAEEPDSAAEEAKHLENHLAARVRQGFDLSEILDELLILGRCVAGFWEALPPARQPAPSDLERFHSNLQRASLTVTRLFQEHMQSDEQQEKRYLRVLQAVADAALRDHGGPLADRLKDVLEVVMEATGAQLAALLLFRAETQELVTSAAAGIAGEELDRFASSVSPASFPGAVAASDEPTQVRDAATTELEVSDSLRRSGIHSLLGIRLPPHHELLGILYIGITGERSFSPSEARRLEALGEKLTLHLENARLYADLREQIAELDRERGLREHFLSVLAHDLRGPLSTAKMGAQLLARNPEVLDRQREIASRIERALDGMDRMIRDLLDVNRFRAGQRLSLHLRDCDLGRIAEQVVGELRLSQNEDRIVLHVDGELRGVWSADELRRALWNLVSNALKHGAPDQPVVVRAERTREGARLSVHNSGNPIPVEHRARIFEECQRLGGGLGLTLVRACAEAHGGKVTLSSSAQEGTTFAIELPGDARPFRTA